MLVGYARVSTADQNLDRQLAALEEAGVDSRNIYKEQKSGIKDRPALTSLLDELKPEDTVVIADLTRISRSTKDLLSIVDAIKAKGAYIKSIKDTWLDTTNGNPYNEFLLTVMAGLSQLERDLISSRTKEGLKAAEARGRKGGRPNKRNEKAEQVMKLMEDGYTIAEICSFTNLSRSTIYRVMNGEEIERNLDDLKSLFDSTLFVPREKLGTAYEYRAMQEVFDELLPHLKNAISTLEKGIGRELNTKQCKTLLEYVRTRQWVNLGDFADSLKVKDINKARKTYNYIYQISADL